MITNIYKKICLKKEYISFDIFDTLIERRVLIPSDIYALTGENILGKKYANKFRYDRLSAEKIARSKVSSHEVSIEQIYDNLDKYDELTRNKLMIEELRQEYNNALGNKKMIALLKDLLSYGKKCVLISDMYLSKEFIYDLLRNNGVDSIAKDFVFISNECECNKVDGRLYKHALETMGISTDSIVHIGDSFKADVLGARKVSVQTILCFKKHLLKRKIKSLIVLFMAYICGENKT